jgi:hypothetical protein
VNKPKKTHPLFEYLDWYSSLTPEQKKQEVRRVLEEDEKNCKKTKTKKPSREIEGNGDMI